MSKECSIYHLLFFFLFTGNILLFSACNDDDEPAEWIRPVELNDIDAYIKTGILLETFQEKMGYTHLHLRTRPQLNFRQKTS